MSLQAVHDSLKAALDANDLAQVATQLPPVKLELTKRGLLFPSGDSHSEQDLVLARSILEIAAFHAIRTSSLPAFERYMSLLSSFYSIPALPPSPSHPPLLSLHLLSLLSTSRTAAFHTLIETLTPELLADEAVHEVVELERGLMEGSYNKVWRMAGEIVQREGVGAVGEGLIGSIRNEIAISFSSSYASLPLASAQQLLFLPSSSEVTAFAQKRGWTLSPSSATIFFPKSEDLVHGSKLGAGAGAGGVGEDQGEEDGMRCLIDDSLGYARELEMIV